MNKFIFSIIALMMTVWPSSAQFKYTIPFPEPVGEADDTLSVLIIGDVMMHSPQLNHDYTLFFERMETWMSSADITVANMEFTLAGKPYSGYPCFSAPDGYAGYMAGECGVDLFLTANNHILDKGGNGLDRTLGQYRMLEEEIGVRFTGSASDMDEWEERNPLVIEKNGFRIAFINFTYGTNLGSRSMWPRVSRMDRSSISEMFARAREKSADFIIVLPHWGKEYELIHDKNQEEWAEWLISEGADAVIGAHPHVVQDSTHISGKPVFYSIGNAVSNMSAENTRLELAVTLKFVNNPRNSEKRMLEPHFDYLWCTRPGTLTSGYETIKAKEWSGRRNDWTTPSDYDNMMRTIGRVSRVTGLPGI